MSTLFFGQQAVNIKPISFQSFGELYVTSGFYDLTAALVNNDTMIMCQIPAGCIYVDIRLSWDQLSTSQTGWTGAVAGFVLRDPGPPWNPAANQVENYAPWFASPAIDITAPGVLRGQYGGDLYKLTQGHLDKAYRYPIYMGVNTASPMVDFVPGRMSLDVFFRAAESNEYFGESW